MSRLSLPELVEIAVREYPDWSRAERRDLSLIVGEVIEHLSEGTGNGFIQWWCKWHLFPRPDMAERFRSAGLVR